MGTHLSCSPSSLTLSASLCTAYTMVEPLPTPTTLVSEVTCASTAFLPASSLAASTVMVALVSLVLAVSASSPAFPVTPRPSSRPLAVTLPASRPTARHKVALAGAS